MEIEGLYIVKLVELHMLAEDVLIIAEKQKRPVEELAKLHDVIRDIIHVRD